MIYSRGQHVTIESNELPGFVVVRRELDGRRFLEFISRLTADGGVPEITKAIDYDSDPFTRPAITLQGDER